MQRAILPWMALFFILPSSQSMTPSTSAPGPSRNGKPELFKFAFIPKYDDRIRELAEDIADSETWDFVTHAGVGTSSRYPILKNYLEHTFRKLQAERKIVYTSDNQFTCFNTGLVTPNLEDIFALFEIYKPSSNTPRIGPVAPYYFRGFCKESDGKIMAHFSHNLPEIANYFDKPDLLLFNPKCKITPDLDHIITDNIQRFPAHLKGASGDELRRQLHGAIVETNKKVRSNYKIAIPQYYSGQIQLLLPLCLTAGSPNPDLALVTTKVSDTMYSARTCLTLEMAYNNARLVVKPQSEWLKP